MTTNNALMLINSDMLDPNEISNLLGIAPTRAFWKSHGVRSDSADFHPFHVALYEAGVDPNEPIETHLEKIMDLYDGARTHLVNKPHVVAIHCFCEADTEMTLHLRPPLIRRMLATGLEFVFNFTPKGATA
jgi:hypothetical protein